MTLQQITQRRVLTLQHITQRRVLYILNVHFDTMLKFNITCNDAILNSLHTQHKNDIN